MKASTLIHLKMVHPTAPDITGEITDILFALSLKEAVFLLADVTTPRGTAHVLFSPTVLVLEEGIMKISAHPDDVIARVDAAIERTKVPIDPADLPSAFIGPFGNTFSPSMIAALFNARTNEEQATPPTREDGVWFSELEGHAVQAHVANVGHVSNLVLDDHFSQCKGIEITSSDGATTVIPPAGLVAQRSGDDALLLSIVQADRR